MNIGIEGVTNNYLAEVVCVTKQATSKVIRELEGYGLVQIRSHEGDARRSTIELTTKGKELVVTAVDEVFKRMAEYEKLVGKEKFHQALDTMYVIMEYEKELWEKKRKK
jgi:DNA-binding MarR family transcriptional regulator